MDSNIVHLYIYDLSDGWCGNLGPLSPIKAIWHTSIVVFGREYVFGTGGIIFHKPAKPLKILEMGETRREPREFKIYVKGLKYSTWTASSYDPLEHNCNHFTDHLARYLGVGGIPDYIFESTNKLRDSSFYSKLVDKLYARSVRKMKEETQALQ